MKKHFAIIMAAAFSIGALSGCGSTPAETAAAETTAAETTAAAAETTAEAAGTTEAETTAAETTAEAAETTAAEGLTDTEKTAQAAAAAEKEVLPGGDGSLEKVQQAGKIVLGTSPDFAPWEFIDISSGSTEYVGSDIELAKYIAKELGVELEVKPMEFSAILQAVSSGNVDMGISGFAYTEERAEAMGLSHRFNKDKRGEGQGLLVKKGEGANYNSAEAFAGKKIAAQNASLQMQLSTEQLPSDVSLQPIANIADGVMMLVTGKVDALAVSGDNGVSLEKTYPDIEMAEFKFDYTSGGNVLGVKKGNNDLLNAINEIIDKVNEEGLYEQWKAEGTALAESLGIETNE